MRLLICILTSLIPILYYIKHVEVAPPQPQKTGPPDYYIISLQWPKSFCNTGSFKCQQVPTKSYFTIHGLWPQYKNPYKPVSPFNQSGCTVIPPVLPRNVNEPFLNRHHLSSEMLKYWPDLKDYSNVATCLVFWQHEWQNHGMCSQTPNKPEIYFKAALDFIQANNISDMLSKANISPGAKTYKASDISFAITKAMGVNPQIKCNTDSKKVLQLHEVWICLDTQYHPIHCSKYYNQCKAADNLLYPAV